jgi:hypothetical protein
MNTKRVLFGILAVAVFGLTAVSCSDTAEDESLYTQSIEKGRIKTPPPNG